MDSISIQTADHKAFLNRPCFTLELFQSPSRDSTPVDGNVTSLVNDDALRTPGNRSDNNAATKIGARIAATQ